MCQASQLKLISISRTLTSENKASCSPLDKTGSKKINNNRNAKAYAAKRLVNQFQMDRSVGR